MVHPAVLERGQDLLLCTQVGLLEHEAVVAYLAENGHNHVTQFLVSNILVILDDVIQKVTELDEF